MRISKSLTIEPDVSSYVDATKDERSAGDRVNELLPPCFRSNMTGWKPDAAEFFPDARRDLAAPKGAPESVLF